MSQSDSISIKEVRERVNYLVTEKIGRFLVGDKLTVLNVQRYGEQLKVKVAGYNKSDEFIVDKDDTLPLQLTR